MKVQSIFICTVMVAALAAFTSGAIASDTLQELQDAYMAQRSGDHKKAIELYTVVLKKRTIKAKQRAVAYLLRGESYLDAGELDSAISDLSRSIRIYRNYAHAYYFRSQAYEKKGEVDKALKDMEKASSLKPESDLYKYKLDILKAKAVVVEPVEKKVKPKKKAKKEAAKTPEK